MTKLAVKLIYLTMILFLFLFTANIIQILKNEEIDRTEDENMFSKNNALAIITNKNLDKNLETEQILCNSLLYMNSFFAFIISGIINNRSILNIGVL